MGMGWVVSLILTMVIIGIIMAVMLPMNKRYIVKENGKINYKKTKIFLRWNRFDTLTLCIAIYAVICIQVLNMLISFGENRDSVYVQFFTNQGQVWTLISIIYLSVRISNTLKSIKARWGDSI